MIPLIVNLLVSYLNILYISLSLLYLFSWLTIWSHSMKGDGMNWKDLNFRVEFGVWTYLLLQVQSLWKKRKQESMENKNKRLQTANLSELHASFLYLLSMFLYLRFVWVLRDTPVYNLQNRHWINLLWNKSYQEGSCVNDFFCSKEAFEFQQFVPGKCLFQQWKV